MWESTCIVLVQQLKHAYYALAGYAPQALHGMPVCHQDFQDDNMLAYKTTVGQFPALQVVIMCRKLGRSALPIIAPLR